ncbi:MAG: HAMP domain-containing histidine kinase, partial [Acidimicrobiia bacterium]|nr:HAMP domain-containing histidine kinase [Acidimicrobiia bacterium]
MHRALDRQLRRLGLSPGSPPDSVEWGKLLEVVSSSYDDADKTRYRLERALSISSEESRGHSDRQLALTRCAHALLASESASPERDALEALCAAVSIDGGWIARLDGGPDVVAVVGSVDGIAAALASHHRRDTRPSVHSIRSSAAGEHDLCAPIYVHDERRGTIGLRIARDSSVFSDAVIDLVATAASMVGAYWAREQAQERLEALIASKDQFVASISHELRTPLTGVVGFAHELASHWHAFTADEARELVDLILEQSEDVANLVEDLLVVARSDIERIRLHPEELNLRQQAFIAAGRLAGTAAVLFEGHGTAIGDAVRVRQVIRNLVTNAVRYGGPRIRIRIAQEFEVVHLEVRDDGPGIPEESVELIFEAFQSAHDVPTQPGSVGLGLWVAKTLARLMNGSLDYRR